jgi:hypothetical protein
VATQHYKNDNVRSDTVLYHFGKHKTALVIHPQGNQPGIRLIFSPQDTTITGLFEINGKMGGYILPMDEAHWPGMRYALQPSGAEIFRPLKRTGQTREIQGFP